MSNAVAKLLNRVRRLRAQIGSGSVACPGPPTATVTAGEAFDPRHAQRCSKCGEVHVLEVTEAITAVTVVG